jgi:hypothetical protein
MIKAYPIDYPEDKEQVEEKGNTRRALLCRFHLLLGGPTKK